MKKPTNYHQSFSTSRGYSLVELIVAVGLFAIVALLSSGAYLIMINANREAQAMATGINNLSYALESMTRNIRTGSQYSCPPSANEFSFKSIDNKSVIYRFVSDVTGQRIQESLDNGVTWSYITDPLVVIENLTFDCIGTAPYSVGNDTDQAHVVIVIHGTVSAGPGTSKDRDFYVETSATMRGTDL